MSDRHHSHLTLLRYQAEQSGASSMFKIPVVNGSGPPTQWTDVSFSQFYVDVNTVAHFLMTWLQEKNIPPRSTVGVWFSGYDYIHFVYIMAISRASYVPQMLSSGLTDPGIILELMRKGETKAIIYEPSLEPLMHNFPYETLQTVPINDCPEISVDSGLPDLEHTLSEETIWFVYHTSGSTSGSPKLVPYTGKFVRTVYQRFEETWGQGGPFNSQDVVTQIGSICHAGTLFEYLGALNRGACLVQPSNPHFSTLELFNMVKACGLNRLALFSVFLSTHIKAARQDSGCLELLQEMRCVWYGGIALPPEDEDWGHDNHIAMSNVYGNTECGLLMTSTIRQCSRLIRPLSNVSHTFDPVEDVAQIDNPDSVQLYEFVILADSLELPQAHLLSYDGNFRTGDLFEKKENGYFIFRGRGDDWIKSDTARRCDTKAIEDNVRVVCSDIIKECSVTGSGRPSPALFVERPSSKADSLTDAYLKDIILNRTKSFNDRRYTHERVTDQRLIFVVPDGSLPRTAKGNIRRKAVEETFLKQLDEAYNLVYA